MEGVVGEEKTKPAARKVQANPEMQSKEKEDDDDIQFPEYELPPPYHKVVDNEAFE